MDIFLVSGNRPFLLCQASDRGSAPKATAGCLQHRFLSLTVQKRKTSRISSVYAGFETFFIVNRYAYVAPSFWKNRMKGARARLSLIPGAEFSTRAYLSYKRLSYFFVCLHMFLIFAIGINSFEVSNPKAWCRESVSSLRL